MTTIIALAALATLAAYAIGASIVALRNDGYHPMPTDYTRLS